MKTLAIDVRKMTHSGIGRYLRNLLPGVLPGLHADTIQLIGKPDEIRALGPLPPHVLVHAEYSTPHSPAEQMLPLRAHLGKGSVLWVPHYNVPLLYRGALVCTVHDLAPLELAESFGFAKRALARLLLWHVGHHAAAILTPSAYSRGRIVAMAPDAKARITVTPLAVDLAWPALAAAPQGHREGEPYLLFVGNLKPNKNLATLLEALGAMGEKAPLLLVAGKTEGFRTSDDRARRAAAALGDRVRLLGGVSDDDLIALYRGAAALVMPSLYEGFGLPLLEAMRYECPVLCSDVTSLPEVAGDAALYFDPRDPAALAGCIRAVLDSATAERLRYRGIEREAAFTYASAIEKTTGVLNRVLESHR